MPHAGRAKPTHRPPSLCLPVPLSPCLPVSLSFSFPCLSVAVRFRPRLCERACEPCGGALRAWVGACGYFCIRLRVPAMLQLPLSLLRAGKDNIMLVELKNGETYNGILVNCDIWMNLSLRDVVCTSRDGDKFWKIPECYIRGNNIKYLRVPDEIIEKVVEEPKSMESPLHVFSPAFARHRLAHAPLAHAPAHARASVRPQLHTLSDGLHRVRRGTQGLCGPGKRAGRFRCKPGGGARRRARWRRGRISRRWAGPW